MQSSQKLGYLLLTVLVALLWAPITSAQSSKRFEVVGHLEQIDALNSIQNEFGSSFTNCALWDAWIPYSTLWTSHEQAQRYRDVFLQRPIDAEGYVSMQQHRGMAHNEGWPFPAWQQSTGKGWHFSVSNEGWAVQNFRQEPLQSVEGWTMDGAVVKSIDPDRGLVIEAASDLVTITTPAFQCGTIVSPFVRLEWLFEDDLPQRSVSVEWMLDGEPDFVQDRRVECIDNQPSKSMHYLHVPMYRHPKFAGLLNRLRVQVPTSKGSEIVLKSIITAIDTRHPITNSMFVMGATEYFLWTRDIDFLKANIDRMRTAMQFAVKEFQVEQHHHVYVPWVGHDGRSGLTVDAQGKTTMRPGLGVGNNYWDLLPFGGHDALATIYLHQAMRCLTKIEEAIDMHPGWLIGTQREYDPYRLKHLSARMKADFQQRFWNPTTQRFAGWIDVDGNVYDYGFTFVNLEAIHYGLASEEQSKTILGWLNGDRTVEQDTSTGKDIYHWRFGPRATTRRNIESYVWAWNSPASIEWGGQVQDGGAVLGFSYFDLSSRLKVLGPDDAWIRLQSVVEWKRDVDAAGGYRTYYELNQIGTLQGCGTAGGLGIDCEFFESVLVPQILLRGFLGFEPTAVGCEISPQLPSDWPSLTVRDIHLHGYILHCTVHAKGGAEITVAKQGSEDLIIEFQGTAKTLRLGDEKLQWN